MTRKTTICAGFVSMNTWIFPLHMHYKFPLMWLGMLLHPTHFAQATLLSSSASLLCIMANSTSIRVPILILVLLLMHMKSSEARTFQFRVRLRIKEWIAVLFYVICWWWGMNIITGEQWRKWDPRDLGQEGQILNITLNLQRFPRYHQDRREHSVAWRALHCVH